MWTYHPAAGIQCKCVEMLQGTLQLYPVYAKGQLIFLLRNSGSKLIGIKIDLIRETGYTGDRLSAKYFQETKKNITLHE